MAISTISSPAALTIPGSVIQTVQTNYSTEVTTTGTTWVTSGLTASITPKFSTSKILVIANIGCFWLADASKNGVLTIYRGSTNLSPAGTALLNGFGALRSDGGSVQSNETMVYLDSPATTSSTTYTVYFANFYNGFTVGVQHNGAVSTMTLMEIAG